MYSILSNLLPSAKTCSRLIEVYVFDRPTATHCLTRSCRLHSGVLIARIEKVVQRDIALGHDDNTLEVAVFREATLAVYLSVHYNRHDQEKNNKNDHGDHDSVWPELANGSASRARTSTIVVQCQGNAGWESRVFWY
ncbi:hypothetical protein ANO14919_109570 [Xylariales sp. No.14919]|nr:hypothetical protein ANO14919_109570 [Xylariales sp. No.14919]